MAQAEIELMQAALIAEVSRGIQAVRTELMTEMRVGTEASSQKVLDLEARLIEKEVELKEINENFRQSLAEKTSGAGNNAPSDNALFRNAFYKGDEMKEFVRAMGRGGMGVDSRAIDTALFANGGNLAPETANRFIDFVVQQDETLKRVRTMQMNSPTGYTDELRVAARKLRKAVEGTAPAVANSISFKRHTLTNIEMIWAEDLTLTFLEDNIERAGAEAHIAEVLAKQFGTDLDDLAWNGNVADVSADAAFLTINEGWFKLLGADAEVNTASMATLTLASDVFRRMYNLMPEKYKGLQGHTFFTPIATAHAFANEQSKRETPLGDTVLVNGVPSLRWFGIPIIPDVNIKGATNGKKLVLTPAQNLTVSIQRNITSESEWMPRRRVVELTMTMRGDFEYANGEAVVLGTALDNLLS